MTRLIRELDENIRLAKRFKRQGDITIIIFCFIMAIACVYLILKG